MNNVYVYSENDKIRIGNDYIERVFVTKDDCLHTQAIINKRIDGGLSLTATSFSAEFFISFREDGMLRNRTSILSSNELKLDNINIFKNRVEFIFKPYAFSGAKIVFVLNIVVDENSPYMSKYIEMIVDERYQQNITVDYIDCEHLCFTDCKGEWCVGKIEKAYLSKYHSALGQPMYLNGMFFVSTFPLAETKISKGTAYIRYFCGKRFDKLNLSCGTAYRTWSTVCGAADSVNYNAVRREFFDFVRSVSRKIKPRVQYNSWYDHMLDITEDNIIASFEKIENGASKALLPPLDSYVVDDGFSDYKGDFWNFNSKFPNGFENVSAQAKKFSSNFGMWLGPRGGYNNETKSFAKRMENSGKGGHNKAAGDVCVADKTYINNLAEYFIDKMARYDVNYWKLDGFLLKACPSKKHGHITGGYNDMYEYTEMWESWIDLFRKMRIHRETAGKNLWINQTSYCNASPMFLQWADSLWMQNSDDMGMLKKTKNGEALPDSDVDKLLSYRDSRYYDFYVRRQYQVPPEYIYNHDPIYGNTANVSMTDSEYRKYLFMMALRGNYFWELYFSYNMLSPSKWQITADVLRFVRNNADILKNSVLIGSDPETGGVYGYSAFNAGRGIAALRNPSKTKKEFTFVLNEEMGCDYFSGSIRRACVFPYSEKQGDEEYAFGDSFTVTLNPSEVVIMKFTNKKEKTPSLIYGRFQSENELLLFFDDRIYIKPNMVTSDKKIQRLDILEDYSTLKITFSEPVQRCYVSLTAENEFGDMADSDINAEYYSDFVCGKSIIPNGRDFTVSLRLSEIAAGNVFKSDGLSLSVSEGGLLLRFFDKKANFTAFLTVDDKIDLVCEPSGLIKLFVNNNLLGSVYKEDYINSLCGQIAEFSALADDIQIISKAKTMCEE